MMTNPVTIGERERYTILRAFEQVQPFATQDHDLEPSPHTAPVVAPHI